MNTVDTNQTDDTNTTIFVEPPDVHDLTDKDFTDEKESDINHLSRNELRTPAFITSTCAEETVVLLAQSPLSHHLDLRAEAQMNNPNRERPQRNKDTNGEKEALKYLLLKKITANTRHLRKLTFFL